MPFPNQAPSAAAMFAKPLSLIEPAAEVAGGRPVGLRRGLVDADDDAYNFIAHQGQPVIIYAEMEGFQSKLNDRDLWETITSQHLTIYSDRDGIPVWNEDWQKLNQTFGGIKADHFLWQHHQLQLSPMTSTRPSDLQSARQTARQMAMSGSGSTIVRTSAGQLLAATVGGRV